MVVYIFFYFIKIALFFKYLEFYILSDFWTVVLINFPKYSSKFESIKNYLEQIICTD